MAIICISRGAFVGGQELARCLEQRLRYRVISREQLFGEVERLFGFAPEEASQTLARAPSRLDQVSRQRRKIFVAVQAAQCRLVRPDRSIFHGQAGHLLLPAIDHAMRLRVIAPHAVRVQHAVQRIHLSPHDASRHIDQVDRDRTRWTEFVFGANWADPSLYDGVINLERLTIDQAADVVAHAAGQPCFQATERSTRKLEDLGLASELLARLLSDPATDSLDLSVEAHNGVVSLGGPLDSRQRQRVIEISRHVDGIEHVQ